MGARSKFDQTKWKLERERFHLTDPKPPHSEPDLSLRGAIAQLFTKLDSQTGSGVHKIQSKWKLIAGETVAAHSRPGRLNENILYVFVDSSAWLAEITRFHSGEILRRIKNEIGPVVKQVRFKVNPEENRMALNETNRANFKSSHKDAQNSQIRKIKSAISPAHPAAY